jgi:uncharacterized MAPEG superfamily protein
MSMGIELTLLAWAVVLTLVQMVVSAVGANQQVGLDRLAGNREDLPALTGWAGRAKRAHANMLENIVLFAALVLIVQVAGKTNWLTALGAHLFFWGRLAYAVIYVAGIPWLRTAAWAVSIAGLAMLLIRVLT